MSEGTQSVKPVRRPKSNIKKRRRSSGGFAQISAVFIVFLAFYLGITLFVAGLIYYSFKTTSNNSEIYSINVFYDDDLIHKIEAEDANNEYGLYLPFSYLSEIGAFGLAGDGDDITLFIIGSENRIKCTKNSSLIVINDNPIRISAPILYEENEYLIPIVLLENYINGIDISYDNEEMICIVSSDLGKSDVALKILLPEAMEAAYFPDSYKYYNTSSEESE